ncbi:hypothetical protein TruAng_004164 [Truncatella angustata]|nr:hypothetical protein TruAng_004164 [Truncatella angustata]
MYKYRINKWNLRKNLRHRDVEEFVRSNKTPKIRGGKATPQRIDNYLQRRRRERPAKKHGQAAQHVDTLYDDQKTDGAPSTALSVVANKVRLPGSSLFSPRSPDGLRLLEGSIHAMRSYTSGHFDAKIWVLDSQGDLNVPDRALEWHGTWYTVRHLMEAGRAKQAFRVVQKCNQVFGEILVSDSPRFFSSALLVFLGLSSTWPDLAASVLRYMHSLSRIIFRESNHPMVQFLSNICKIETISAGQKAVELCVEMYGLADDFTVDNLASYENYLRECGNDDEADQVKGTLKGAMDELCSGIEELGLD